MTQNAVEKSEMDLFEITCRDGTVIVTPVRDLNELSYETIETQASKGIELLDRSEARNVIIDLHRTDYYGSTALGYFLKLWKRVRKRGGRMILCGVSAHEREILELTRMDTMWPICSSLEEAEALLNSTALTRQS